MTPADILAYAKGSHKLRWSRRCDPTGLLVFLICLSVGCSLDGPSASGKNVIVGETRISPDASFVESRSDVAGGERRIYLAPASADLRQLVEPPAGFWLTWSAPSSGAEPQSDGAVDLLSYAGPNPHQPNSGCSLGVASLPDLTRFRDPPAFDPAEQQIMLVSFSC